MHRTKWIATPVVLLVAASACSTPAATSPASPTATAAAVPTETRSNAPTATTLASTAGTLFRPGDLTAGTYTTGTFQPGLTITLPAGWHVAREDREVLELTSGDVTVGISRRTPLATAQAPGSDWVGATVGGSSAFTKTFPDGTGTLWFTEGSVPFDPPAGSAVQTWLVVANGKAFTIDLIVPKDRLASAATALVPILASFKFPS